MKREILDAVRLGAILGACLLLLSTMATASPRQIVGTARVKDGDTLSVAGAMVRLEGIDAPELTQLCAVEGGSWRAGDAARAYLAQLVSSKPVTCTGMGEDEYGRLIALPCKRARSGRTARARRPSLGVRSIFEDVRWSRGGCPPSACRDLASEMRAGLVLSPCALVFRGGRRAGRLRDQGKCLPARPHLPHALGPLVWTHAHRSGPW
jgi:hypothetical protein